MCLVAVLKRYVAVSYFTKHRMEKIPDSPYIKMEHISLERPNMQHSGTPCILSDDSKAES